MSDPRNEVIWEIREYGEHGLTLSDLEKIRDQFLAADRAAGMVRFDPSDPDVIEKVAKTYRAHYLDSLGSSSPRKPWEEMSPAGQNQYLSGARDMLRIVVAALTPQAQEETT